MCVNLLLKKRSLRIEDLQEFRATLYLQTSQRLSVFVTACKPQQRVKAQESHNGTAQPAARMTILASNK